jgi:hypothetical protein
LSPTPSPELDEEYQNRRINKEAARNARRRHKGEDLIWRTHMQRQEFNLNQHARQLDIHEAHLCRREHRCDHHEAEARATRLSGMGRDNGSGSH